MMEGVSSAQIVGPIALPSLSGKIMLPVRPAVALMASFKHIQVIPDFSLKNGVPFYKLSILDNLLDLAGKTGASRGGVDRASVDTAIEDLSRRLRSPNLTAFSGGTLPDKGLVVDLVA